MKKHRLAIAIMALPTLVLLILGRAAGFDYMEARTSEAAAHSDVEFERLATQLRQLAYPEPACLLVCPGGDRGAGDRKSPQMEYLHRPLDRVAGLRVGVIVFGSGEARQVPEGFPVEETFRQLVDFGKRAGGSRSSYSTDDRLHRRHLHMANPNNRVMPLAWGAAPDSSWGPDWLEAYTDSFRQTARTGIH